ncbi:MAG: hypothetical protein ACJASV_000813 [Pseudorhodobacter sp.]|jgi:hypothetical protein
MGVLPFGEGLDLACPFGMNVENPPLGCYQTNTGSSRLFNCISSEFTPSHWRMNPDGAAHWLVFELPLPQLFGRA